MARIKIPMPEIYPFATELPVRISDINYGGHLGNDAILSMIHEARVRFLKHHGYTELEIEGAGFIMADSAIVYKSEGFYGDTVRIQVAAGDFSRCGCDLYYRLTNRQTGLEVAHAKTGMVFFNYQERKVVPVPERFQAKVTA